MMAIPLRTITSRHVLQFVQNFKWWKCQVKAFTPALQCRTYARTCSVSYKYAAVLHSFKLSKEVALLELPCKRCMCTDGSRAPKQNHTEKHLEEKTLLALIHERWKKDNIVPPRVDSTHTLGILEYLLGANVSHSVVVEVLSQQEGLLHYSLDAWQHALTSVRNYGFSRKQALYVIADHTAFFNGETKQISHILEALRTLGFGDGTLHKLVTFNPTLLDQSSKDIFLRFDNLQVMFSKADCIKTILQNPNILTNSMDVIQEKCDYVFEEMGIDDDKQIIESRLFSCSLFHIKCRHTYLIKAGFYKKPKKKGEEIEANPQLSDIVDTTDERFAKEVAGTSAEEYEVYTRVFKLELDGVEDEDNFSDEDDDDDILLEEDSKSFYKKKRKGK